MQREAELADESLAGWPVAQAPAKALNVDIANPRTRRNGELIIVDNHAHRDTVHFGDRAEKWSGERGLRVSKQRLEYGMQDGSPAAAQEIAPVHGGVLAG
jgi:hypothetical protein